MTDSPRSADTHLNSSNPHPAPAPFPPTIPNGDGSYRVPIINDNSTAEPHPTHPNPQSPTLNSEWRFDLSFTPDWLQQPATPAFAALNDWVRGIGRNTTHTASLNMLGQESEITHNRTTTATGPDGLIAANRSHRGSLTVPGPRSGDDSEIPSSLGSSRRDSNSYVIDVDLSNQDWNEPPMASNHGDGSPGAGGRRDDGVGDNIPEGNPADRTAAEILRQSPEVRACLVVIERYFPFLLIVLVKGLFDHGGGILMFAALMITFSHTNTILKKEVAKQGKRSVPYLFMISVNLILCIIFMYYVFKTDFLHPALIFLPTDLPLDNVCSLLWLVLVTDYVAKFITVIMKSIIICLPESVIPFQKRGKHYLFVESSSQLYRSLLPICPWLGYLFGAYEGTFKLLSILLCMFYLMCKVVDVVQRLRRWKVAFHKLLQPGHYGTTPTEEELVDLFCPICHDSFTAPTKLSCSHIFCEECVSTWLDRGERSCPMCRAKVCDDTSWRDGSTSHFIQIF